MSKANFERTVTAGAGKGFKIWLKKQEIQHMTRSRCVLLRCPVCDEHKKEHHNVYGRCTMQKACFIQVGQKRAQRASGLDNTQT